MDTDSAQNDFCIKRFIIQLKFNTCIIMVSVNDVLNYMQILVPYVKSNAPNIYHYIINSFSLKFQ